MYWYFTPFLVRLVRIPNLSSRVKSILPKLLRIGGKWSGLSCASVFFAGSLGNFTVSISASVPDSLVWTHDRESSPLMTAYCL